MLRFKFQFKPSHWEFKDPDTGESYEDSSIHNIAKLVEKTRKVNGAPPLPELAVIIENYTCSLTKYRGMCEHKPIERTLKEYIQGGVALLKHRLSNDPMEPEEIEARRAICKKCPYQVSLKNRKRKTMVAVTDKIAEAVVPKANTKNVTLQEELGSCRLCSCPLEVKVLMRGPFNNPFSTRQTMERVGCWQVKEENGKK